MEREIRNWNPAEGLALQGDVSIIPVPANIAASLNPAEEIPAVNHRLILQEGEVTGHHHAIDLRPFVATPLTTVDLKVERLMSDALDEKIALPSAKLYRDAALYGQMQRAGILTRTDLCVGVLVIETGPMALQHPEHDGIRIPVGTYVIGRQVESAGAEERVVAD